ncbi:hypothetical protein Tco_0961127 [Tanacetum coccineum]
MNVDIKLKLKIGLGRQVGLGFCGFGGGLGGREFLGMGYQWTRPNMEQSMGMLEWIRARQDGPAAWNRLVEAGWTGWAYGMK